MLCSFPAVWAQSSPCQCHWTPTTSPFEGQQCCQTRAGWHYWALQRTCKHFWKLQSMIPHCILILNPTEMAVISRLAVLGWWWINSKKEWYVDLFLFKLTLASGYWWYPVFSPYLHLVRSFFSHGNLWHLMHCR